ncbi:MAG: hypothetical protein ACXWLY_09725 [Thermoanaerobaculia bacterium]
MNSIDAAYSPLLAKAKEELRHAGVRFGSSTHIASLPYSGWPLSAAVRDALSQRCRFRGGAFTHLAPRSPGLMLVDADLATQLRDSGLSPELLRASLSSFAGPAWQLPVASSQ